MTHSSAAANNTTAPDTTAGTDSLPPPSTATTATESTTPPAPSSPSQTQNRQRLHHHAAAAVNSALMASLKPHNTKTNHLPPHFPFAPQADIIRCTQKDSYYALYSFKLLKAAADVMADLGLINQVLILLQTQPQRLLRSLTAAFSSHQHHHQRAASNQTEDPRDHNSNTSFSTAPPHSSAAASILLRFEQFITLLGMALYELLSIGTGRLSLGEEYCDLMLVRASRGVRTAKHSATNTPLRITPVPLWMRQSQILLKYFLPYILLHLISNSSLMQTSSSQTQSSSYLTRQNLNTLFHELHRFHLALFYLSGSYLHLSKRLFGIRYLFTGRPRKNMFQYSYQLLAYIILLQQLFSLYRIVKKLLRRMFSAWYLKKTEKSAQSLSAGTTAEDTSSPEWNIQLEEDEVYPSDAHSQSLSSHKCPLCLESRRQTTATSCGHLYCWECITDCFSSEETINCPTCRSKIEIRTLCRVYHYDGLLKVT